MARNYVALPHEYRRTMECLSDAEFGRLIRWLLDYSATGKSAPLSGRESILCSTVQLREDQFQASFEEVDKSRSEHARKAATSRWNASADAQACSGMPEHARDAKTKEKTKDKTKTKTLPSIEGEYCPRPTVEEVASYARERNSSVDPERFVDYYASRGWKIGTSPMEDWKAAFRNWEREEKTRSVSSPSPQKATAPVDRWDCSTPYPTVENVRTLERLEMLRRQMNAQSSA